GARETTGPAQADGEASDYLTTTFIRICVGWIVQITVKVPRLLNLCEKVPLSLSAEWKWPFEEVTLWALVVFTQRQVTFWPFFIVTLLVEKKLSLTETFLVAASACAAKMPAMAREAMARSTRSFFRMGRRFLSEGLRAVDDGRRRFLPPRLEHGSFRIGSENR